MRELTVRIKFVSPCLGNVKAKDGSGRFLLPRNTFGQVTFMATWHRANLRLAAQLMNRHQDEVGKILWDMVIDGTVLRDCWSRRYYGAGGNRRYSLHESFKASQTVGVNCVVPTIISDDDFWRLMALAGQYRGLSPFSPGDFGFFEVASLRQRRATTEVLTGEIEKA